MNSAVHLDVHILTDLVVPKIGGDGDVTFFPEGPREEVTRPRPDSVSRRHGCSTTALGQELEEKEVRDRGRQ